MSIGTWLARYFWREQKPLPVPEAPAAQIAAQVASPTSTPIAACAEDEDDINDDAPDWDDVKPARRRNAFDDFMDAQTRRHEGKWLSATIAGVSHRNEDGTSRQQHVLELRPYQDLKLVREPHNKFSERAVAVFDSGGRQLGYLPEWLTRDVSEAIDSGGTAACYVQHIRQTGSTVWAAAIGVLWSVKRSPRTEFRATLDARADVEEWFWAKVSGTGGSEEQSVIEGLIPGDELEVDADEAMWDDGRKVCLVALGGTVGKVSKQQSELIVAGIDDGRTYKAVVFEVREHARGHGLDPVVAILLMKE